MAIFSYLHPLSSLCLGSTCKKFYAVHCIFHWKVYILRACEEDDIELGLLWLYLMELMRPLGSQLLVIWGPGMCSRATWIIGGDFGTWTIVAAKSISQKQGIQKKTLVDKPSYTTRPSFWSTKVFFLKFFFDCKHNAISHRWNKTSFPSTF